MRGFLILYGNAKSFADVMELLYTTAIDTDCPIMWVDNAIGDDGSGQPCIMGDLFSKELHYLDGLGKRKIQVNINSVGGFVTDGYAIFNAILATKTPVDTNCIGIAASIAAVIFQAGRKRIMADYGILMYHNPHSSDDKKALAAYRTALITMIAKRSGLTDEKVGYIMDRETYINADEARMQGLCDEVVSSAGLNTKWLKKDATPINFWKGALKIQNKAGVTGEKIRVMDKDMLLITTHLGLNEAATGDNIIKAIKDIQAKADAAEVAKVKAERDLTILNKAKCDEMDKMKADLDDMENKFKVATEAYNKAKAAKDAMEKEKQDIEDATRVNQADLFVKDAVKTGRIKNEAAEAWKALAVKDYAGTKALVDNLPVNKIAAKIVTEGPANVDPTKGANTMAYAAQAKAARKARGFA